MLLFKLTLLPRIWGDEKITTESKEFLLPNNENGNDLESREPAEPVTRTAPSARVIVAGVLAMILWGAAAFRMGQGRDGSWGSFENGFLEEQVISMSANKCLSLASVLLKFYFDSTVSYHRTYSNNIHGWGGLHPRRRRSPPSVTLRR